MMFMSTWITTETMTLERARELLAQRVGDLPIYLRWYRTDTSRAWGSSYQTTVTLEGVTDKRIKVRELGGAAFFVKPARLRAATRQVA